MTGYEEVRIDLDGDATVLELGDQRGDVLDPHCPERLDRQLAHQRVVLDHQDPGHRAEIPILFSSLLEANVRANE
jgi:hypothetical protein